MQKQVFENYLHASQIYSSNTAVASNTSASNNIPSSVNEMISPVFMSFELINYKTPITFSSLFKSRMVKKDMKRTIIDILGWTGTILYLVAHGLISAKRVEGDSWLYQGLNIAWIGIAVPTIGRKVWMKNG